MQDQETLIKIQEKIASQVITKDELGDIRFIAGVDQAFLGDKVLSGMVLLNESLEVIECRSAALKTDFPYVPGFLAFRECPAIIEAFKQVRKKPDLLIVDGCGINHPRFAGLASHAGVTLDVPTIGVSKNILCGSFDSEPEKVGEFSVLSYMEKDVGAVLKTKEGCRPIIVAPGHRVSLRTSIEMVKKCLRGYKLPEPTRLAHDYAASVLSGFRNSRRTTAENAMSAP